MSEIKKLGFGLMRLPQKSDSATDIDMEQFKKMVDLFLEQLDKCGVEYFDYYLLHNLNRFIYATEVRDAHLFDHMKRWKEQGRIRHIAFSYHDDAAHLDEILTEHPEVDAVQIVLNYYDWDEPFIQSKKCYEVIRRHGKRVIVMEPVKGGMLAKAPAGGEHIFQEIDPNASPASFAIRFAASQEGVLAVLSGMSDLTGGGQHRLHVGLQAPHRRGKTGFGGNERRQTYDLQRFSGFEIVRSGYGRHASAGHRRR